MGLAVVPRTGPDPGVEFWVHVRPRASRERAGGTHGDALVVRVHAAPTEGRANAAVRRLLADALEVRPAAIELAAGARSRRKRVRISGDPEQLSARLEHLAQAPEPV